ncbi:MAG: ribokinase [Actinomycetota bacterium]
MHDVTVVGSANLDLVAHTERIPDPGETLLATGYAEHPGGKGLNQAVAAARAGAATAFIGALGDDDAGTTLGEVLVAAGVDDSHVMHVGVPTGRALITVSNDAENTIIVVPGANARLTAPTALFPTRVVATQLEIPLPTVRRVLELGRGLGAMTLLNPAPATRLDTDLLALVDVLTPNEHELALLGGTDALHAAGVGAVVVTLGAAGAAIYRPERPAQPIDPFPVDAIDTTGSGDAFNGTLATLLADGATLSDAVRVACAAGALAATTEGAVPSLPARAAIDALVGG